MPKLVLIFFAVLYFLMNIILIGFIIQFQHIEIHDKALLLPNLNKKFKHYFLSGLKIIGITLFYFFYVIGLSFCFSGFLHFGQVIKFITISLMYLGFVISIVAVLFSECSYADTFSFKKAIDLEYIFKLMAQVKLEVFLYVVLLFLFCIIKYTLYESKNTGIFVYPFIITFLLLIMANFSAQLYKIAKNRIENKEIATQNE